MVVIIILFWGVFIPMLTRPDAYDEAKEEREAVAESELACPECGQLFVSDGARAACRSVPPGLSAAPFEKGFGYLLCDCQPVFRNRPFHFPTVPVPAPPVPRPPGAWHRVEAMYGVVDRVGNAAVVVGALWTIIDLAEGNPVRTGAVLTLTGLVVLLIWHYRRLPWIHGFLRGVYRQRRAGRKLLKQMKDAPHEENPEHWDSAYNAWAVANSELMLAEAPQFQNALANPEGLDAFAASDESRAAMYRRMVRGQIYALRQIAERVKLEGRD